MKNYRLLSILFAGIFLSGIVLNLLRPNHLPASNGQGCPDCLSLFPGATHTSEKQPNPPHYLIFARDPQSQKDTNVGYAFHTTELAPEIFGYAGPIDLLVGVDKTGTVTGVKLLSHHETTSYVSSLETFLLQFLHKDANSPLQLGKDIDGITGATISSNAITQAMQKSLTVAQTQILRLSSTEKPTTPASFPFDQIIFPTIIFASALAGIVFRSRFWRRIAMAGGFLYLGILTKNMVAVIQVANIGLGHIPSFAASPLWHTLLFLTATTGIVFGMVYCGSVCPFAAVQEFLYNIGRQVGFKSWIISDGIDRKARYLKHIGLLAVLTLSLLFANPNIANVEVYVTFFTHDATRLAWLFLFVVLAASLFSFRFWCKYLCPIGALNGLVSYYSLLKLHFNKRCNRCGTCQKICPVGAIRIDDKDAAPAVDAPECILCKNCVRSCPEDAVHLRRTNFRPGLAKKTGAKDSQN